MEDVKEQVKQIEARIEQDPYAPKKPKRPAQYAIVTLDLAGWEPNNPWNGSAVVPVWKEGKVVGLRIQVKRVYCPECGADCTSWDFDARMMCRDCFAKRPSDSVRQCGCGGTQGPEHRPCMVSDNCGWRNP